MGWFAMTPDKSKREKITPCILAAVVHNKKILLIHRNKDPYKGYWAMTGGKIEFAEHVEETAEREVLEETGLRCKVDAIKGIASEIIHSGSGAEQHFLMFVVQLSSDTDKFVESDEGKLQWFGFNEIESLESMVPSDKLMIKEFILKQNKMKVHRIKVRKDGERYDVEEFI
jgi:8-oxo-dGTP diphosphatase